MCAIPACEKPAVEGKKECIDHEGGYGLPQESFKYLHLVELHPGCDRWMMGDRFGTVMGYRGDKVRVQLDRSGKTLLFEPERLRHRR